MSVDRVFESELQHLIAVASQSMYQSWLISTDDGFCKLPEQLGYHPKLVKVVRVKPNWVAVFIHRQWWQRAFKYAKRRMSTELNKAYQTRKAAGIFVEVYVR